MLSRCFRLCALGAGQGDSSDDGAAVCGAQRSGGAAQRRSTRTARNPLVEMIHVASLIHDDVIDNPDMRRGRASVNARWQSRNAVVVGDYILAKTWTSASRAASSTW